MRANSLDLKKVSIHDSFWSKHVDLVRNAIIPYQWEAMNDRIPDAESSHCLENFKIAAGRAKGDFYGAVFQDTDVAKWLEAVGFSLACYPDEVLEKTADEVIDLIADAQCEDGYINTYFTIKEPDKRWTDLCEGHELYTAGHLMEAAVAYYEGTGKRKFLDCMCKFADLICDTFGTEEGKIHGYPGHEEVEIGLIKLARVTGNKKYMDQAKYFVDARGVGENYFMKEMSRPDYKMIFPEFADYTPAYSQSHKPVREQTTAEGHAVRAVYLYCAMADLAEAYQDEGLLKACKTLWNNIVEKRMYLTGGIGSSGHLERFTVDYDLPNEYNYSESCASIGLALFGLRMAQITGESQYMDVAERALYNTVLAGIALDGKSFFYVNPLEVLPEACHKDERKFHVKPVRQKWFGCACCPPNLARLISSIGAYAFTEKEDTLFVHLYMGSTLKKMVGEREVQVRVDSQMPWDGEVAVTVEAKGTEFVLAMRIPGWCEGAYTLEGAEQDEVSVKDGYLYVKKAWGESDTVKLHFAMPVRLVEADERVREDAGRVAVMHGPVVYCLEAVDNGENLHLLEVEPEAEARVSDGEICGNQVKVVLMEGYRVVDTAKKEGELYHVYKKKERKPVELRFVPYYTWANRGENEMEVWVRV